ncbi:MAG: hypothetical protein ACI39W_01030 [Brotaphodocola sp.]
MINKYNHKNSIYTSEICLDLNKNVFVDAYFFGKKNLLTRTTICKYDLIEKCELFLKSYMIIFVIKEGEKDVFLRQLKIYCREYNCYGPIVNMEGNEILFFPKLRYQEGMLIKSLLQNVLTKENFDVRYGNILV